MAGPVDTALALLRDIGNGEKVTDEECAKAVHELKEIAQHLQPSGQTLVKEIVEEIIPLLKRGQNLSAKIRAQTSLPKLNGHLGELNQQQIPHHPPAQQRQHPPRGYQTESPAKNSRNGVDRYRNENREYEQIKRSKEAARQLRDNNPDITDLSDVNRPTKIAERFSELYDNEWTEAFEVLTDKKQKHEREVVDFLLAIVTESYRFCINAFDGKLQQMMDSNLAIIGCPKQSTNDKRNKEGLDLLHQFLKIHAGDAISSLQEEFSKKDVLAKNQLKVPLKLDGIVTRYARRCVGLCWWMVVQDPPVYMVPTEPRHFDAALYRVYTKSGSRVDYFVWPALRLYKDGGILFKGVVQYK